MSEPASPLNQVNSDDFAHAAEAPSRGLLREFLDFLRSNRKWWMLPILLMLLLAALLVVLGSSMVAPFIYTLF